MNSKTQNHFIKITNQFSVEDFEQVKSFIIKEEVERLIEILITTIRIMILRSFKLIWLLTLDKKILIMI